MKHHLRQILSKYKKEMTMKNYISNFAHLISMIYFSMISQEIIIMKNITIIGLEPLTIA